MNIKNIIPYVLTCLLVFVLTSSDGSVKSQNIQNITGTFQYLDSDGEKRPIAFAKVEIHSFAPRGVAEIWSWDLAGTVTTDATGSISVQAPGAENGVVYGLKIFATNYAAVVWPANVVWPNDAFHTVPFHQEPGEPNSIYNRTYGTDVLDFSYEFTDASATQHYNIAETIRLGNDYAVAHRDPNETDLIGQVNVQPTSAVTISFYNPTVDTILLSNQIGLNNSQDVFEDFTILHEYAHFLQEQIGSFLWQPSIHDGCTAKFLELSDNSILDDLSFIIDPLLDLDDLTIINNAEHAWMEGFADYFARVAGNWINSHTPPGKLLLLHATNGDGTPSISRLEAHPSTKCRSELTLYPADTIELAVAATLWDLYDDTPDEAGDTVSGRELEVFQIFDRELDTYGTGPTICYFRNAWLARGLDQTGLGSVMNNHGMASCQTPPPPNWGNFQRDACQAMGIRQYSSILHDIPPGMDWEDTCYATPATIEGQNFSGANRCVNTGLNIWGEFDVSDSSCSAYWGSFKRDACRRPGIRQYSAILWDIPSGVDWEDTCYATPATIEGQNFSGANRCVNTGLNIWGEFDVSDSSCR